MKNHKIIEVKTMPGKILWLRFKDGSSGEFVFTEYFSLNKELSKDLKDDAYFAKVTINKEFGCIEWPNGYDPSPDVLYAIVNKKKIVHENKVVFDPALGKNAWL